MADGYTGALGSSGPGDYPTENEYGFLKDILRGGVPGAMIRHGGAKLTQDIRELLIKLMGGKSGPESGDETLKKQADVSRSIDSAGGALEDILAPLRGARKTLVTSMGGELPDTQQAVPTTTGALDPGQEVYGPPAPATRTGQATARRPSPSSVAVQPAGAFGPPELVFAQGGPMPATANTPTPSAPTAAPAATPQKTLPELYTELMAKVNQTPNTAMTPEQQRRQRLAFFANMGSRPNERIGTATGGLSRATLGALKRGDEQEAVNRALEVERIRNARTDVSNLVGAQDKQSDNERQAEQMRMTAKQQAEQLRITAKHYENTDKDSAERLKLLAEQVSQGRMHITPTSQGIVAVDLKTGKQTALKDSKGRPLMPYAQPGAGSSAEERIYSRMMSDPKFAETVLSTKRTPGSEGNILQTIVNETIKASAKSAADTGQDPGQAVVNAINSLKKSGVFGGGTSGGLPAGVPAGSTQIGTSGGKPVYQTPDGKRVTVK